MVTGYTGTGSDSPEHEPSKRITEGKFAPKLSVKSRYKLADGKPFEKDSLNVDQDIWLPPFSGDTNPFMLCLDKDSNYKKTFQIQVGNIPDEEIEDHIRKVSEKFKKVYINTNAGIQPDLDCGIYNDNKIFYQLILKMK